MFREGVDETLNRAQTHKTRSRERKYSTSLFQSEYNQIIMLCYQFSQAFIEVGATENYWAKQQIEARRNRLFLTIAMMAEQRDEIPTVREYFGNRKFGKFRRTIAEMQALEYVSAIQDKVMELMDQGISPEVVDDRREGKRDEENKKNKREKRKMEMRGY